MPLAGATREQGPEVLLELLTLQGLLPRQHPDVCRGCSSAGSNNNHNSAHPSYPRRTGLEKRNIQNVIAQKQQSSRSFYSSKLFPFKGAVDRALFQHRR